MRSRAGVTAVSFGCERASGVGQLKDVGLCFTGTRYLEILKVFIPAVKDVVFPQTKPFYLVQDNSPINTSRIV